MWPPPSSLLPSSTLTVAPLPTRTSSGALFPTPWKRCDSLSLNEHRSDPVPVIGAHPKTARPQRSFLFAFSTQRLWYSRPSWKRAGCWRRARSPLSHATSEPPTPSCPLPCYPVLSLPTPYSLLLLPTLLALPLPLPPPPTIPLLLPFPLPSFPVPFPMSPLPFSSFLPHGLRSGTSQPDRIRHDDQQSFWRGRRGIKAETGDFRCLPLAGHLQVLGRRS